MQTITTIYTTMPNKEAANKLTTKVITQKLAACANVFDSVESIYHWQGKLCTEPEVAILFKTLDTLKQRLVDFIDNHHPYETPVIIASQVECHDGYYHYMCSELA